MPCQLLTKMSRLFNYSLNNSTLERVESYAYLGITLADNFSWLDRVHKVVCKVNRTLGLLWHNHFSSRWNTKKSPTLALSTHSFNMPARYGTRTTKTKSMTLRWSSIVQHGSSVEIIIVTTRRTESTPQCWRSSRRMAWQDKQTLEEEDHCEVGVVSSLLSKLKWSTLQEHQKVARLNY